MLQPSKWIALFLLSLACGAIIHTAQGIAPPVMVRAVLLPVSSAVIVLLWIATRSFFDDEFRFGLIDGIILVLWFTLSSFSYPALITNTSYTWTWPGISREVLSYGLVIHIVFVVLSGSAPDLVESRRRARAGFTFCILFIYLFNKAGETIYGVAGLPIWFTAILYGLITVLLSRALLALIRLDTQTLGSGNPAVNTALPAPAVSPEQQRLIDRLTEIIEDECAYLEPELSVRALASRIGIPEHRLRALINQSMGFRNFRSYLNGYRIKHSVSLLTANTGENVSIADIAMRSGFGSLATFNRLFKSSTGVSPREMKLQLQTETAGKEKNSPHFQN